MPAVAAFAVALAAGSAATWWLTGRLAPCRAESRPRGRATADPVDAGAAGPPGAERDGACRRRAPWRTPVAPAAVQQPKPAAPPVPSAAQPAPVVAAESRPLPAAAAASPPPVAAADAADDLQPSPPQPPPQLQERLPRRSPPSPLCRPMPATCRSGGWTGRKQQGVAPATSSMAGHGACREHQKAPPVRSRFSWSHGLSAAEPVRGLWRARGVASAAMSPGRVTGGRPFTTMQSSMGSTPVKKPSAIGMPPFQVHQRLGCLPCPEGQRFGRRLHLVEQRPVPMFCTRLFFLESPRRKKERRNQAVEVSSCSSGG